eukprot:m.17528 g.17528  ORF g.17528 m.17528 type:complete len:221 (+) comp4795_c0_seq2:140-802(+)
MMDDDDYGCKLYGGERDPSAKAFLAVRSCVPSDVDALKRIHAELFPLTYPDDFFKAATNGMLYSKCLANRAGNILAFLIGKPLYCSKLDEEDKDLVIFEEGDVAMYIMTIGVVSTARRQGLGTLLLHRLLQSNEVQSPNCKAIFLHVLSTNSTAIAFYLKQGFQTHKHLKSYYSFGEVPMDATTLVKYVNGGTASGAFHFLAKILENTCLAPLLALSGID